MLQRFAHYIEKAAPGMSGGPLLIKKDGSYFVIGLHQCQQNDMHIAVLINNYGQTSLDILRNLEIN